MGLGLGRFLEFWMYIQDIEYIPQGTPAGGYCNRLMFEQYDIVLRDRVLYTYNILETDI